MTTLLSHSNYGVEMKQERRDPLLFTFHFVCLSGRLPLLNFGGEKGRHKSEMKLKRFKGKEKRRERNAEREKENSIEKSPWKEEDRFRESKEQVSKWLGLFSQIVFLEQLQLFSQSLCCWEIKGKRLQLPFPNLNSLLSHKWRWHKQNKPEDSICMEVSSILTLVTLLWWLHESEMIHS